MGRDPDPDLRAPEKYNGSSVTSNSVLCVSKSMWLGPMMQMVEVTDSQSRIRMGGRCTRHPRSLVS